MKTTTLGAALSTAIMLCTAPAHAIDIDAGDYTPLPPGTNVGLLYVQHAERNRLYDNSNPIPGSNGLDSDIGILRMIHFMDIGGYTVNPQFLLPFGRLKATGNLAQPLGQADGTSDLILAATVWPINDPKNRTFLGITPFLYVPTGNYDKSKPLNLGENRWKYALQASVIFPATEKVTIDLAADVTGYGRNDKANAAGQSLGQSASSQVQAFARYALNPAWDLRAGLSWAHIGNQTLGGVSQDNAAQITKFQLGTAGFLGPKTQLLATWGRDISVNNGFRENTRVNLRLLQLF
jgi:hypothetical protein